MRAHPLAKGPRGGRDHYQLGAEPFTPAPRRGDAGVRRGAAIRRTSTGGAPRAGHRLPAVGKLDGGGGGVPPRSSSTRRSPRRTTPWGSSSPRRGGSSWRKEFDLALSDMLYREAYVARCNKGQRAGPARAARGGAAELRTCLSLAPRYCQGHRERAASSSRRGGSRRRSSPSRATPSSARTSRTRGTSSPWRGCGPAIREGARAFERCESAGRRRPARRRVPAESAGAEVNAEAIARQRRVAAGGFGRWLLQERELRGLGRTRWRARPSSPR